MSKNPHIRVKRYVILHESLGVSCQLQGRKKEGGALDIQEILAQVDAFYAENKGEEAEGLMCRAIGQAVREENDECVLQLLNELLGYYRETSQKEKVFQIAEQAIAQAKRMGLEGSIPYATTILNVATAYRACGRLQESLEYYGQVQEIYDRLLEPDSMFMAGLKNNVSLLYQEMGNFPEAKARQLEALKIAEKQNAAYETGVTYANLANTCMELGERQEARSYAEKAAEVFRKEQILDSHYAAALSTLGACSYHEAEYEKARSYYVKARDTVEKYLGKNAYYERLQENVTACERALDRQQDGKESPGERGEASPGEAVSRAQGKDAPKAEEGDGMTPEKKTGDDKGLVLAREYYEQYGKKMIEEQFPEYAGKIAVGLAGRGSDCYGYDDAVSRDHDWGPGFCMWITDETFQEIGQALQNAYNSLPLEYKGYKRGIRRSIRNRRGVIRIPDFLEDLAGTDVYELIDWRHVNDVSLSAIVNGEIFRDDEGILTAFREKLKKGYPQEIRYLKMAEGAAKYAQAVQYNYPRMLGRGDDVTARMMVWDGIKEAMKLQHYIENRYPVHDKWLLHSMEQSEEGREVAGYLKKLADSVQAGGVCGDGAAPAGEAQKNAGAGEENIPDLTLQCADGLAGYFVAELYAEGAISDKDCYLDAHSAEMVFKASLMAKEDRELAEEIARLEFEAFDKVKNEGGRAVCQNDWSTFSIMRKSQYLTWNRTMLIQYFYDFYREFHDGRNLIEEKYGRMMESTAPEKYEEIKDHFPELSPEKKAIIEQITALQVNWMEEFCAQYPVLGGNARNIHTYEDTAYDTSYETYLRGELGTYSDKMLEMYGRYVVEYARLGRNPAYDIMKNSVKMYGYKSVEEAEKKIGEYEAAGN